MTTPLAHAVRGAKPKSWRPAAHRRTGEFLPVEHRGIDPFVAAPDKWSTVVLQVFWFPPPALSIKPKNAAEAVVLLGEAFVPPMATLGTQLRSHRLPLHQSNRRAPDGAQSWDDWEAEFLARYLINQRLQIDAAREAKERKQAILDQRLARRRDEHLSCLEKDLKKAYPDTRPGTPAKNLGRGVLLAPAREGEAEAKAEWRPEIRMHPTSPQQQPPKLHQQKEAERLRLSNGLVATPRSPERLMAPEVQQAATGQLLGGHEIADVLRGLPSAFQGISCLDVALAFLGPENPEEATVRGYDGVLSFELQTLRVPPLDHGYVRIRIAEVAEATPRKPERPEYLQDNVSEFTDSSRQLGALLSARSRPGPPPLPTTRPLWFSPPTALGSDGQGQRPRCTADWSFEDQARASIWISARSDVLHYCAQDLLRDSARDGIWPAKPKLSRPAISGAIEVGYDWTPVQLSARKPLPRSNEQMEASALIDPATQVVYPEKCLEQDTEVKELIPHAPAGPKPAVYARRWT
mmetsp:Transcript_9595/g.17212  ORF Transcript_9595/g.17212 Transcript_9595/m.17212 type:complete len:520 (-) Transcript_9595:142-1701(-)